MNDKIHILWLVPRIVKIDMNKLDYQFSSSRLSFCTRGPWI